MSSLADIIAQETQDGRLIVRFLVSAMEDLLPDFQPCHRIDAARRSPTMEFLIREPEQLEDFLARYAKYLIGWNIEHPHNPIDINRIYWTKPLLRNHSNPARAP